MQTCVNPGSRGKEKGAAKVQADKHQAESTQEAEAMRKREPKAQAAKCQAESTQVAEVSKKREPKSQAAKHQAESTQKTEASRKREKLKPRQISTKLSQPRKQR